MAKGSSTPPLTTGELLKTETSENKPIEISTGSAPTVVSVNSSSTEQTKAPASNAGAHAAPIPPESDELSGHDDYDEEDESDPDSDEDEDDDSDIYCACCGVTEEIIMSETVKHVEAFLAVDKDKHHVDVNLEPLNGPENWKTWSLGIRIVLRMHQVGVLLDDDVHFAPLEMDHDLYLWSKRMIDVAIAVIYANVSQRVRNHPCFMHSVSTRDPNRVMRCLSSHYGNGVDSDYEDDEDLHAH